MILEKDLKRIYEEQSSKLEAFFSNIQTIDSNNKKLPESLKKELFNLKHRFSVLLNILKIKLRTDETLDGEQIKLFNNVVVKLDRLKSINV